MVKKTPPESDTHSDSHLEHASAWLRQFSERFQHEFVAVCEPLATEVREEKYQEAAIRATVRTLLDSGMAIESVMETVGQVAVERDAGSREWNSALNQRRFDLIDKEIQGTLTPTEKLELAGLTKQMRDQLDSEANLPTEGVKALHEKLLELERAEKAS